MNKPANVDFLIATDSEMKKVNWTSRKELIGSTKVVILFMFLIAVLPVRRGRRLGLADVSVSRAEGQPFEHMFEPFGDS